MKKIFTMLLLLLCGAGGAVWGEDASQSEPVEPGKEDVSQETNWDFTGKNEDASGKGYSWNNSAKTLTLENADIEIGESDETGILLPADATVVLKGANAIHSLSEENGLVISSLGG